LRSFIHNRLGKALHASGVQDLRSYAFVPMAPMIHSTLGVSHDNPSHRRYHGAIIFGTATREDVNRVVRSPEVTSVIEDQHTACIAVHAFSVERTVSVVRAPR
jgi:hypothetical protein